MYSEIIKIIEGGLSGDKAKTYSYSKKLADELEKSGEKLFVKKIRNLLEDKKSSMAIIEQFSGRPVDQESRLDMLQISKPNLEEKVVLDIRTKNEIENFIKMFKYRNELSKKGISDNLSMLLYGYPGCGKTTLAKYIASELDLPLLTVKFDTIISSLLGSTSKNIRRVFEYASTRPCILFLDEFDVIAKARDDKNELGELKRVVNTLIQNMDIFSQNGGILLAATNHEKLLDSAIWRRFNYVLEISKPGKAEIIIYLNYLMNKYDMYIDKENRVENLSVTFDNMSYAEINKIFLAVLKKNVIENKTIIDYSDLIYETFIHKKCDIKDEEKLIDFLIFNGLLQKEIHEKFNIPLRDLRKVKKEKR